MIKAVTYTSKLIFDPIRTDVSLRDLSPNLYQSLNPHILS